MCKASACRVGMEREREAVLLVQNKMKMNNDYIDLDARRQRVTVFQNNALHMYNIHLL